MKKNSSAELGRKIALKRNADKKGKKTAGKEIHREKHLAPMANFDSADPARENNEINREQPIIMINLYPADSDEREIINKYYFLKDINSLATIIPDDDDFASEMNMKYDVPIDDLRWLIRDIRDGIQKNQYDFNAGMLSRDKHFWDMLCSPGIEFKKISITSNMGVIDIEASHPFWEVYFYPQILKIESLRSKILDSQTKDIKFYQIDIPLNKIWKFFNRTSLGEFQKRVAIGMFLVHFKLYKGKPYLTESEWNDQTEAQDYDHYLSDIVKARLKGF